VALPSGVEVPDGEEESGGEVGGMEERMPERMAMPMVPVDWRGIGQSAISSYGIAIIHVPHPRTVSVSPAPSPLIGGFLRESALDMVALCCCDGLHPELGGIRL
jgi:hypothetical protein